MLKADSAELKTLLLIVGADTIVFLRARQFVLASLLARQDTNKTRTAKGFAGFFSGEEWLMARFFGAKVERPLDFAFLLMA